MLDKSKAADIFDKIKNYSTADEVEALFYGGRSALTRFANNTIHQNVAEENYGVSVRTVFGGRTARASTNKLDDESLRRVVQASESLAKVQHPDPELLPMPASGGQKVSFPIRYFDETAAVTPEQRAEAVHKIVSIAQRHKLTTAGIFATAESIEAIFNSRSLSDWHTQTSSEISITMLAADSSGWQKANSPNVAHLDAVTLGEVAARKALESAAPREIPAGKYTVILEPAAVLDIVGFMFFDFGGLAILDQRSFLNNRVGAKIFGDNINITDDVGHPLQSVAPARAWPALETIPGSPAQPRGSATQKSTEMQGRRECLLENPDLEQVAQSSRDRAGPAQTGNPRPYREMQQAGEAFLRSGVPARRLAADKHPCVR